MVLFSAFLILIIDERAHLKTETKSILDTLQVSQPKAKILILFSLISPITTWSFSIRGYIIASTSKLHQFNV